MPQKNWDKYEVALLIEAYQNIKQGRVDRTSALILLSQNLRQMAQNDGLEIDDTFRNLNGMTWQMGFIEKAFNSDTYESRTPPHIFIEMVDIYQRNPQEYQKILDEAHIRVTGNREIDDDGQKELFIKWLDENVKITTSSIVENISYVSAYANKHGMAKKDFWSFRDYKEFNAVRVKVSGGKIFKLMHGKEHRQFEKTGKLYSDFLKKYYGTTEENGKEEKNQSSIIEREQHPISEFITEDIATSTKLEVLENIKVEPEEKILDFEHIPDLSYTKPIYAVFNGIELDALNWKLVYISILHILYKVFQSRLNTYMGKSLCGGMRIDLSLKSSDLISPKLISADYTVYAESNLSANDIAKRLIAVLKICKVPYDKLLIKYQGIKSKQQEKVEIAPTKISPIQEAIEPNEAKIIEEYTKWLVQERGMTESTSRGYGSNLKVANIRAQEYGLLDGSLFEISDEDLQVAISKILTDSKFSQYNSQQHNRFSAALQAYLLFKIGAKATGVRTRKPRCSKETVSCPDELKALLLKKFPFGIRVESSIDMMKLKNFAEMLDVTLTESEELLKAQVSDAGIFYDGKIYFVSDEVFQTIIEKINNIFAEGYRVIYYEELLGRNFEWFDENHISSWELIREILDNHSEDLFISKNFLRQGPERINEADAMEQELENVWGDNVTHSYDEMYELLPYIPDEKIKYYLSYSKKFVWSTHETFAWIDKVIISEEEKKAIIDYVTNECELVGHASIANVPLGNVEEENYQMSITAIYDAVYNLILKDTFALNGKILTKNNSEVDALTLAKAYCVGKEICTFTELNEYVTSINGTINRQITFRAAYDQMIRVEENKFVADKLIHFDVDEIDNLLEQIIVGDFVSVRSVVTFIMFPNCGFVWTHYLMESFCYRFSKKFRLEVINFNDKNAGIIVKKEANYSYTDMLATTAANSKLDLNTELIGQYLYDNGYIARRKAPIINAAVEKAKLIREGR